jgi:hypothetical protein
MVSQPINALMNFSTVENLCSYPMRHGIEFGFAHSMFFILFITCITPYPSSFQFRFRFRFRSPRLRVRNRLENIRIMKEYVWSRGQQPSKINSTHIKRTAFFAEKIFFVFNGLDTASDHTTTFTNCNFTTDGQQ